MKLCAVLCHPVVSDSLQPHGLVACQAPMSMKILQAKILEWVAMPSSRVIFPTQELNWGLLHGRHSLPEQPNEITSLK